MKAKFLVTNFLSIFLLAGCATFFDSDRDPASFDRGYSEDGEPLGSEDDEDCVGRFCVPQNKRGYEKEGYLDDEQFKSPARVSRAIDAKDIVLGMTRNQVLKSWGEPMMREVAGKGTDGHERWRYGSRYSLQGERVLIFENGRVAGWYR